MTAQLRKTATEALTTVPEMPANWRRFIADRDAADAYLSKPMSEWTDADWREFNAYENDARNWTRIW